MSNYFVLAFFVSDEEVTLFEIEMKFICEKHFKLFLCTFVAFIFWFYVNLQVTVTSKNRAAYVLAQEANKSLMYVWLLSKFCPPTLGMVVSCLNVDKRKFKLL